MLSDADQVADKDGKYYRYGGGRSALVISARGWIRAAQDRVHSVRAGLGLASTARRR